MWIEVLPICQHLNDWPDVHFLYVSSAGSLGMFLLKVQEKGWARLKAWPPT